MNPTLDPVSRFFGEDPVSANGNQNQVRVDSFRCRSLSELYHSEWFKFPNVQLEFTLIAHFENVIVKLHHSNPRSVIFVPHNNPKSFRRNFEILFLTRRSDGRVHNTLQ